MISLILPYWNRQEAADRALASIWDCYAEFIADEALEVIVIDDGNAIPFVAPTWVHVTTLPYHEKPRSPLTAWNIGAEVARGDVLVLSCIEMFHVKPVLMDMLKQLRQLGDKGYVLAAAWCPEMQEWHCHSTREVPTCPPNTGIGFCGMLSKNLYMEVGGFDAEYAEGAGYEDRDFIWRLHKAGAEFCIRDDLVVHHPKGGATIIWGDAMFARNLAIYNRKQPQANGRPINFVCVKWGTEFGPEYVNILYDSILRNMPYGYPGNFYCITEDEAGLHPNIKVIPLPPELTKWWGKLYMFKPNLFPRGSKMVFMDLDTVIVGALDQITTYNGDFATLQDFYQPERVGPAIILWNVTETSESIWREWDVCGRPENPMGDLWWINQLDQGRFASRCDKLQKLFPSMFVSFKAHCHPYPPTEAKVVCFHGQPRPHNCNTDWVARVWREGGDSTGTLMQVSNAHSKTIRNHIEHTMQLGWQQLEILNIDRHEVMVLVGGGASLRGDLDEIRMRQRSGQLVCALNGSAKYLMDNGIWPDYHILLDAREENASFVEFPVAKRYFIASLCHPDVFAHLLGRDVTVYHVNNTETINTLDGVPGEFHLISGGSTVGLMGLALLTTQGFRYFHLFGFDSSVEGGHHAYAQPQNDGDRLVPVHAGGRDFMAAPWMVAQTQEFQLLATQLAEANCEITVHGDGLLPHVAREMARQL